MIIQLFKKKKFHNFSQFTKDCIFSLNKQTVKTSFGENKFFLQAGAFLCCFWQTIKNCELN